MQGGAGHHEQRLEQAVVGAGGRLSEACKQENYLAYTGIAFLAGKQSKLALCNEMQQWTLSSHAIYMAGYQTAPATPLFPFSPRHLSCFGVMI